MGHVVEQRYRRIQQAVGERQLEVGERQQLFAQVFSPGQAEVPDAADAVRGSAALDVTFGDGRMPAVVTVEIAYDLPHGLDRRVHDDAADNAGHQLAPKCRFSASNPTWNTSVPMPFTRSLSASGAHENSAVHSTNVRSPSVTGVSRIVAM